MNGSDACITLFGVGNIGFRYLQALLSLERVNKIILVDPEIFNIKNKIIKLPGAENKIINFFKKFDESIIYSNLVIISCTSINRLSICEELIENGYRSNILLEKFLFPDKKSFCSAKKLFKSYPSSIYVNQWLRKSYYKELLSKHFQNKITFTLSGKDHGILCNAVHYIDLVFECLNVKKIYFNEKVSELKAILNSKRKSFQDMRGTLSYMNYKKNIVLNLIDNEKYSSEYLFEIKIENDKESFEYFVKENSLFDSKGKKVFEFQYLSQHACDSILKILDNLDPALPKLNDSIKHHLVVLDSISKLIEKTSFKFPLIT